MQFKNQKGLIFLRILLSSTLKYNPNKTHNIKTDSIRAMERALTVYFGVESNKKINYISLKYKVDEYINVSE